MDEQAPQGTAYTRRPLWQWLLLYLVIAVILYGLLYYLVLGKKSTTPTPNVVATPTPTITQAVTPTTTATPSANPSIKPSGSPIAAKTIIVIGTEFAFTPSTITIKKGQTVQLTFKNNGTYPHNWTVSALGIKTPTIPAGQSTTITFTPTQTGSFMYICTVPGHADRGMKGTLIVE